MKHAVINTLASPPRVILSFPFAWMARVAAFVESYCGRQQQDGIEIAEIDTTPQAVVAICTHRDALLEENRKLRDVVWHMVAKNDQGLWSTIHNEDTPLAGIDQLVLDEIFQHRQ